MGNRRALEALACPSFPLRSFPLRSYAFPSRHFWPPGIELISPRGSPLLALPVPSASLRSRPLPSLPIRSLPLQFWTTEIELISLGGLVPCLPFLSSPLLSRPVLSTPVRSNFGPPRSS